MSRFISDQDFVGRSTACGFGLDAHSGAAALRRLADAIDARDVIIQKVIVVSKAAAEEFQRTTLMIEFNEFTEEGAAYRREMEKGELSKLD